MASSDLLTGGFPRITENSLVAGIFSLLAVAIVAAAVRFTLRIRRFHRLDLDDYFIVLARITLTASTGVIHAARHLLYVQVRLSLGFPIQKTPALQEELLHYHKLEETGSVLLWTSIFAVKFSFLSFFRSLIQGVRPLEVWWFVVVGIMALAACACIPLGFMVCSDFSPRFMEKCPSAVIVHREAIYLDITVCLDVLTDLLIISIPTALLWRVKIKFRRKVAIAAALGLSIFMIVIAIIRVANAPLPNNATDSVWIFFWQFVEAAAGIIMVCLTAIRSLFGQQKKIKDASSGASRAQQYINMDSLDMDGRRGHRGRNDGKVLAAESSADEIELSEQIP